MSVSTYNPIRCKNTEYHQFTNTPHTIKVLCVLISSTAPMQSIMEGTVLDQSSTMRDVQAERGVNSGARKGAATRVLATFMAPFLSVLVHVVRWQCQALVFALCVFMRIYNRNQCGWRENKRDDNIKSHSLRII